VTEKTSTASLSRITLLGSTGSIGQSTLDVISRHPDRYRLWALTAHQNVERLIEQCIACVPACAVIADERLYQPLKTALEAAGVPTVPMAGPEALCEVASAPEADTVVAAIVGAIGIQPTLEAARAGKRILLANKEVLVAAGGLFMAAVRESGALLLPVDSEHNAIFQCLPDGRVDARVSSITLTASGGAFRDRPLDTFDSIRVEEACTHPNWSMGRKITIDSATMVNKGLELIEACWLFGVNEDRVRVLLHPQSIVHSLVGYPDGSSLAQLGHPDMRTPIAHCLAWPDRVVSGVPDLDLVGCGPLVFREVESARYPALNLCRHAWRAGESATTALNAANEVAVSAFIAGKTGFAGIAEVIEAVLEQHSVCKLSGLSDVLEVDRQARVLAGHILSERACL
jgi:1-deoxy-D-xylulose-5-phosphate reductoisomerase